MSLEPGKISLIGNNMQGSIKEQGFTLFISIVITASLLLVSTGIITLAVKEAFLTSAARESQHAFYAADTGIECAIYWDIKNPDPSGLSAFDTAGQTNINCNADSLNTQGSATNPTPQAVGGPSGVSTFTITFLPDTYCAVVTVTKALGLTTIESLGYNTCDPTNPRRVERAVRVRY